MVWSFLVCLQVQVKADKQGKPERLVQVCRDYSKSVKAKNREDFYLNLKQFE